jgi:inhibitor of KinA
MNCEALGDQAVLVRCQDEDHATILAGEVRRRNPAWLVDVVQAYFSVAIFYDLSQVDFFQVVAWLEQELSRQSPQQRVAGATHRIPCCYEFGLDFVRIREHTGLTRDDIIEQHSGTTYTVFAIGFCPGFPYLGYLPASLSGVPRLTAPRLKVDAGSVGLTGRQTGIYTEVRPGGWNIVGKTPLQLVDVKDGYFPLRTGDRVQFVRIDERDYESLRGERLQAQ